ncbi:MAG: helix-turn-helix transcriptional regulator [Oscillibacter sp.]|nr:helix-turn-helix transcriptional regulator [Oscillibacter sp.]
MANIQDCPGFETFGADVKAARKQMRLSRQKVAEMLNISQFYLINIENDSKIPSLPIVIQLINIFALPAEKYFNRPLAEGESNQRQRVGQKVKLCPEEYLPIIEGALDGAIEHTYVKEAR